MKRILQDESMTHQVLKPVSRSPFGRTIERGARQSSTQPLEKSLMLLVKSVRSSPSVAYRALLAPGRLKGIALLLVPATLFAPKGYKRVTSPLLTLMQICDLTVTYH
jgi:hypothetical protein